MKKLISAAFLSSLTVRAIEGKLDAYRGFNMYLIWLMQETIMPLKNIEIISNYLNKI